MVKSEMEKLYEAYLRSDDTVRIQDGKRYYRALTVDELTFKGHKNVIITLPYTMFEGSTHKTIKNLDGKEFTLEGPAMIRFQLPGIPRWYLECGEYMIKNHTKEEVGTFFRLANYVLDFNGGDYVRITDKSGEITEGEVINVTLMCDTEGFEDQIDIEDDDTIWCFSQSDIVKIEKIKR